jgi:hypothetical protein
MLSYTNLNVNNAINSNSNTLTNYISPLLITNGHNVHLGSSTCNLNHVNMSTTNNGLNSSNLNGTVVSATPATITNSNVTSSKNILNNSTIKMIQRILEESSQTGDLILTSKNLNEFPSKLANNFDLSDTITTGKQ